ncbi:hypothetical protein E8E11_000685 [Didymella keratinophila]|nr:hypothetical protein E8E11_000685 [Didymella keratinophila]
MSITPSAPLPPLPSYSPSCVLSAHNTPTASVNNNNSYITTPSTRSLNPTRPNTGTYPKFSSKALSRA